MAYKPEDYFDNVYLDEMQSKLDALKKELSKEKGIDPNELDPIIEKIIGPDPGRFEPILDFYASAAMTLGSEAEWGKGIELQRGKLPDDTVSSWIDMAEGKVNNWKGGGPEAFVTKFLKDYKSDGPAIARQRLLLVAFQTVVEAHQAVYVAARQDVVSLLEKGTELLDANCEDEIKITILLMAAVATFASGPSGWSLLAATGSFAASTIGTEPPKKGTANLVGCCQMDLFYSLKEELQTVLQGVIGLEESIEASIGEVVSSLDGSELSKAIGPKPLDSDGMPILDKKGNVSQDYLNEYSPG